MENEGEEEFTEDDVVEMVEHEVNASASNENEGDRDQVNKIPLTEMFKAIEARQRHWNTPTDKIK